MPAIIETTVYQFEELSDGAKEKARAWYREGACDHDWHDFIFEDFVMICTILGITLKTRPVKLMGGGTRSDPCKCRHPRPCTEGCQTSPDRRHAFCGPASQLLSASSRCPSQRSLLS